jgi:polyisoprenoid-binding protein YceI
VNPHLILFTLTAALATPAACALEYRTVVPQQSTIQFEFRQMGVPVKGGFKRFATQMRFDPAKPEAASAQGNNRYEMRGTLTVKGRSREGVVPVTCLPGKNLATFDGSFVLKRLDFGIGEGMWADVATLANEVQVRFRMAATGSYS